MSRAPILFSVLLLVQSSLSSSIFKFGAVLSTEGSSREIFDAKNGYTLYFEAVNAKNDGKGFYVPGRPGTKGFYFKYEFMSREDYSDPDIHEKEVNNLLNEERVHFLGGSHHQYALIDSRLANQSHTLCYHCCAGLSSLYEYDFMTTFGIAAPNAQFTRMLIRRLSFEHAASMSILYHADNEFTRTTCEAAVQYAEEASQIQKVSNRLAIPLNSTDVHPEVYHLYIESAIQSNLEVVIACISPEFARVMLNLFHEVRHPLKAMYITTAPTKQWWVDSFEPSYLTNDIFSSAQWHEKMKYNDEFFNTTEQYAVLYRQRFNGFDPDSDAAAASAVGLTLTMAITDAFRTCDISKTRGEVDLLLYDSNAIECDDNARVSGYDRVLNALKQLDVETFFGRVKFNFYRQNIGLTPVTTQVFARKDKDGDTYREIVPVLPFGYAEELFKFPATNRYKEDCQPGYYVLSDEFYPCKPCQPGESSDRVNVDHCDNCPVGQWVGEKGQSECTPCPPGTTTLFMGASKITDCICKEGYYNPTGQKGLECMECPSGANCDGGTNRPVPLKGFWTNASYSESVMYECDSDTVCLGGPESACETGYTGRLCSNCDDGYFNIIEQCYKCFSKGLIIAMSIGLLMVWYVTNVIVSQSVSSLEMILSWAQLANIIGDINLRWTGRLATMFGIANILDFDVDILEPSCLLKWSFTHNFVVQLCLPFVMTLMGASGYMFSMLVFTVLDKKWIKLDESSRELLSFFIDVPESQAELNKKWDATIATFLASIDITYVTIAKYCFDSLKCESIAGVSVLSISPDVECGTAEHISLIVLASLGITFYVIFYPVYISWKLYDLHNRRAFSAEVNINRYGFAYQQYELDYYFTPAIALIRKLLFVLVLVYMNNPAFQVGTLAIIINASLMIHVYTAPYVETYLDILFNFLLLALMFEAFGGLMFYSVNLPSANRFILEWIVMATLFLLLLVFVVIFVLEIVTKYQIYYLTKFHRNYVMQERGSAPKGLMSAVQLLTQRLHSQSVDRTSSCASSVSGANKEDTEFSTELLHTIHPRFVYNCVRKNPDIIAKWDKLNRMLKNFMSDQSDTSYLSMDPSAKFWRKLVDRFPELIDFLAVADSDTRNQFNAFATNLYRNFYLSKKVTPLPLINILNWRDHAPMAQWLAIASDNDREFFTSLITQMFHTSGNEEAADVFESKIRNGGQDPSLQDRVQERKLSKRRKRILAYLQTGSDPLTHSASKLEVATTVLRGVNKFKSSTMRLRLGEAASSKVEEQKDEGVELQEINGEKKNDDATSSWSRSSSSKEVNLNNQSGLKTSSIKKSVSFKFEEGQQNADQDDSQK